VGEIGEMGSCCCGKNTFTIDLINEHIPVASVMSCILKSPI
jgi:hypothetical protein